MNLTVPRTFIVQRSTKKLSEKDFAVTYEYSWQEDMNEGSTSNGVASQEGLLSVDVCSWTGSITFPLTKWR